MSDSARFKLLIGGTLLATLDVTIGERDFSMRTHTRHAFAVLAFAPFCDAADVFKCKDGDVVVYQERPCSPNDAGETIKLKPPKEITREEKVAFAAASGKIMIGSTAAQVRAAWGPPTDINRSVGTYGVREQWVYDRGTNPTQYVYLEDGVVASWQN